MSPIDVDALSLWQFNAAVEGYLDAHVPEDRSMSGAEADEIWAWMQEKEGLRPN